ncbi:putative phospholipid ABC transporter permease protein MlaE [Anaplasma platys]|uniref:Putative phospholipid ABC transporter permease protein MlaE n=1 Tax=Anaplasma platys TaxID=949 RepID=A0A858PZC4_9RICK|nr:ABC transporter permease [Anaplasma platys]QJC27920.1 putative phospholipid ABC transporter permease protein MlaE [Anaplasma platys]
MKLLVRSIEAPLFVFAALGRAFIGVLAPVGRVTSFCCKAVFYSMVPPYYFRQTAKQFFEMCFFSLSVVAVASLFTGGALVLQNTLIGGGGKVAGHMMAGIVTVAIVRELGPVLIGLIVAGRIGAAVAAELGTMRITEQIDALATLNTDPFRYLIAPRVVALVLTMPVLMIYADVLGIFGGYVMGTMRLSPYSSSEYLRGIAEFLKWHDVIEGVAKAITFGFVISLVGCYNGYHCAIGARGVGVSTTRTSFSSSLLIILLNYIITVFYA